MNIGQASKQSGISAKMIRYYEEIGLLEAAQRSASGYRIYSETHLKTLNFLKHARELGFSSEQMKELISLWKNTDRHSAEVKALTVKHIAELNQKIAHLQEMVN
ncbi:MAG: MerR family transcriptional regulator, partial [Acinetobacter calcoaceticus]